MARLLDGLALQSYCHRLQFSKEVQDDILAIIRSSPPSRTPESRRGNVAVWYPSKKMCCVIKAESHKVEFAMVLEHEHNDDVLEFYDQPPSIPLDYRDKHGRMHHVLHTADYFVFRYNSAGWEECKQTQELIQKVKEGSTRYILDDNGKWRCPPGEAYAAEFGLTYSVRASDEINWATQSNWLFLEDYYQDLEQLNIPDTTLDQLYQIVEATPGIMLADLRLEATDIPSDIINIAIARHALYVDLTHDRLGEPRRTRVFRDRKAALKYRYNREEVDLGADAHPVDIVRGSLVTWDGKEWRLTEVGKTEILLGYDDGEPFTMKRSAFEKFVKDGKIVGVQSDTRSSITDEGDERLERADPVQLARAEFRDRVIHPDHHDDDEQQQLAAAIAAVPERTRERWRQSYRDAEIRYGLGFIGLLPEYYNCGGAKKISAKTRELIRTVLDTHYNTVTRRPKRGAYGEFLKRCEEEHIPTTTQRTFYRESRRYKPIYDQTVAREGTRAAYPFKDYHRPNKRTISRHGDYAWAMAHLDHLEVNLMLCDSKTGELIGKCWLTLMILAHPRRIAAYYLSFDPPSYRSCLMVLRLCVKRYGRLPTAITVDGGPEFRSVYFEKLLALYKVRKHQRPSSEPRFGSPLERLFGTMETQFIHHLLGNTQATQQPRKMNKATDPRRHAVWTLEKLAERVQQWTDEEYDTLRHPALGQSPRQAYNQSIEQDGARDHKRIPYDDKFKKATFPTTDKGTAMVQPGQGVRMNYLDYWCDEMRDGEIEKKQVRVRYDPFDVKVGYAYIGKQWRQCDCPYDEFDGCTERELQLLTDELRKRNRVQYGREQIEITQKQLAEFRRENAGLEVIQRQQRNDRETKAALAVLEGGRAKAVPSDSSWTSNPSNPNSEGSNRDNQDAKTVTSSRAQTVPDGDKLIVFKRYR